MKTEYMGQEIEYDKSSRKWTCNTLGLEAEQLEPLESKITKFLDAERKLPRVKVFNVAGYHSALELGEVTSIVQSTGWRRGADKEGECNVTYAGKRRKSGVISLALATPENATKIAAIKSIDKQIETLRAERDATLKSIPRLTRAELIAAGHAERQP